MHRSSLALLLLGSLTACAASSCSSSPPTGSGGGGAASAGGTRVSLDFSADLGSPEHFYDAPYPSDLRLSPAGTPDLSGLPIPSAAEKLVVSLKKIAGERRGFPVISVGYFHFDGPVATSEVTQVRAASFDSSIVLVDVDPASPERGKLVPTVASSLLADGYLPDDVLAVAARPGFVLHPARKYAYVVFREYGDAAGKPLGVSEAMAALARGKAPSGPRGEELRALYAPLAETLAQAGVDPARVAAATVFTTGDVVDDTFVLSEKVLAKTSVSIEGLAVNAADGDHPGYCELTGTVSFPQYQQGKPPFDSEGLFALDAEGMPKSDRSEVASVVLTIPQGMAIPAKGLPLVLYLHGSGGLPSEATDASKIPAADPESDGPLGAGPARLVRALFARHGFRKVVVEQEPCFEGTDILVATGRIPIGTSPSVGIGASVTLGIRPEHVRIGGTDVNATVVNVELLGHERHVICNVGASRWVIRQGADEAPVQVGEAVGLAIDPHAVHVFDTATTARVN